MVFGMSSASRARITPDRLRRALPWLSALLLNFWLFAPSYVCSVPSARFWPFVPKQPVHGVYQYVLSLFLRRDNLDVFRISIDFALLLIAVLWTAGTRAARAVRVACVTLYGFLWIFLAYDHGVAHYFQRTPALGEDIRLGLNLLHFLGSFARSKWSLDVLGLLGAMLVFWIVARTFRALQLQVAGWSGGTRAKLTAALLEPALASSLWFGVEPDQPVLQLTSKRMYYNYRASRREAQRMAAFRSSKPDLRYEVYAQVKLRRKPAFYLFLIEAYGEILATWDMAPAYRALMARVQTRLEAVGLHGRTAYSASPVHGGTSWLSIASVHTGVLIDRPLAYAAVESVGARIPSLTHFFHDQGYRTFSLQPGSTQHTGLRRFDLFNHDVPVDAITLAYHGKNFGWGHIPDQYSITTFRERFLEPPRQPRYVFYMGLSTHYPWGDGVPPYVRDPHRLNESAEKPLTPSDIDDSWSEIPEAAQIATPLRRSYFRSIAYEWRVLTEWIEAEARASHDNVFVIAGDHQPRLEWDIPGPVTMNTPVHILANDAAFVDSFEAQGFQPGMYADPTLHPALKHQGLFSLLVSKLVAAFGEEPKRKLPYYPNGLPLAAINR
jgi:hypothetical protein